MKKRINGSYCVREHPDNEQDSVSAGGATAESCAHARPGQNEKSRNGADGSNGLKMDILSQPDVGAEFASY